MLKTFGQIFLGILNLLKYPVILVVSLYVILYAIYGIFYLIEYRKGRRPQSTSVKNIRRNGLLYSVFVLAPRQLVEDKINRPPHFFKPQGLIIFTGEQGAGKTVGLVEYMLHLQKCYPLSKCITNLNYTYEDDKLNHWRQLTDYKNGHKGVIVGIDELQNWFSSNQSRNFPPEMLSVITQNRKNRRVILGTAQNFHLLAKPIRGQTTEIRECMTLCGVFTIVRRKKPIIDDKGDVKEYKNRGFYFFVHNKEIRESYDTYKVIESLAESGFQEKTTLEVV